MGKHFRAVPRVLIGDYPTKLSVCATSPKLSERNAYLIQACVVDVQFTCHIIFLIV